MTFKLEVLQLGLLCSGSDIYTQTCNGEINHSLRGPADSDLDSNSERKLLVKKTEKRERERGGRQKKVSVSQRGTGEDGKKKSNVEIADL